MRAASEHPAGAEGLELPCQHDQLIGKLGGQG